MPLYTYACPNHGDFDSVFPISDMPQEISCPLCGSQSKRIIVLGHGGIFRNDALWVRDASKVFEFDGNKPMETVSDLKAFFQKHPNIKPKESHPAFASSIGDCPRPRDEATRKKAIRKKAIEYLRKSEALTVNSRTSA